MLSLINFALRIQEDDVWVLNFESGIILVLSSNVGRQLKLDILQLYISLKINNIISG